MKEFQAAKLASVSWMETQVKTTTTKVKAASASFNYAKTSQSAKEGGKPNVAERQNKTKTCCSRLAPPGHPPVSSPLWLLAGASCRRRRNHVGSAGEAAGLAPAFAGNTLSEFVVALSC